MEDKKHLPLYGIGPAYGVTIIMLTVMGTILSSKGFFSSGQYDFLRIPLAIIGIILIVYGAILWIAAVGLAKIDVNISDNCLVTAGVYAYVRNPIYSAFMIACTGVLLCFNNLWLLILPMIYWAFMTALMKNTEEKWLKDLYGQEYIDYCERVNRCIPWFHR
ncbi:protein-S-isoprenylcysteine O-methyltransferase Ste14 [Kineothrix alysoides]|uniref:Protein-S-isoprenylcysteine O-methyltransferase Ste14 n=1 Tax=Kineothrix alysoides TaxID=1469948 RepID=A0A4R1R5Q2_9FIRM|nr:isoprenylcysteine carboxylmethyltransferase family protein [Kineothrix alysoides]TCL60622.1 protein-S-isoprenylcysteine O-methyltransferase Ste14 [Kineothrix alysoides]